MEELNKKFSDYYQYLDDLRKSIYHLVFVFIIFFVVGFFGSGQILKLIIKFFNVKNAVIVTTSPFQFLDLAMSIGVYVGLVVCFPLLVYYLYDFLKSGLNRNEKKFFFLILPICLFLFVVGFSYGFSVLYFTLGSIATLSLGLGMQNLWDINTFLSQIIMTSALLGLIFEFPIVLTFLVKIRIITPSFLKSKRRHAYFTMFVITSLLPPTDGLSLIIMVVPLIIIFEITVVINSIIYRNQMYLSQENFKIQANQNV